MEETIYENNDVAITAKVDIFESKIIVNGENLIWISRHEISNFKKELSELLDRYRI